MKVILGADHAATELKEAIKSFLHDEGYVVEDVSPSMPVPDDDYPDYAFAVTEKVTADPTGTRGILLCDTGIGMAIAANKVPGVHAALAVNAFGARRSREHNDANVLVLGAEMVAPETAKELVRIFLTTSFSGVDRHARRIQKIASQGSSSAASVGGKGRP